MNAHRELVRYLLTQWDRLPSTDWTTQGFGFLRLRAAPNLRVHVWHGALRVAGVSDIHDHAQWDFQSLILSGHIVNVRYCIGAQGLLHNMAQIVCGVGGGMEQTAPEPIRLSPGIPEIYASGDTYMQKAAEIHRSLPADGTVTLIRQVRTDVETARVFWPYGGEWVDAEPREAKTAEVRLAVEYALKVWG